MKSTIMKQLEDDGFDRYIIECDCMSPNHLLIFDFDENYNYVDVSFVSDWRSSFWQRLKNAFTYVFKNKDYLYTSDTVGMTENNIADLEEVIKKIKEKKAKAVETKKNKIVIDSCFDCNDHGYDIGDTSITKCFYSTGDPSKAILIKDPSNIPDFCPRYKNELED